MKRNKTKTANESLDERASNKMSFLIVFRLE